MHSEVKTWESLTLISTDFKSYHTINAVILKMDVTIYYIDGDCVYYLPNNRLPLWSDSMGDFFERQVVM